MDKSVKNRSVSNRYLLSLKSEKGAAVVEFAIVFPLLILLIFAMIEFGLYLFNRQVITNACREGARFGVVARVPRWSNPDIQNKVIEYAQQHLVTFGSDTLEADDVTIKPIDNDMADGFDPVVNRCTSFGCDLEVQADYNYKFLFLSSIGFTSRNIRGLTSMRME